MARHYTRLGMVASPVLLDLDGTLIDSLADIAATTNHVRAAFGLPPLPTAAVRGMIGDGATMLLRRALADAGREVPVAAAWTVYQDHHEAQCTQEVRFYPGVPETLARWRESGRPLGVVTNKPERFARRILEHLDLMRFFGAVVGGDSAAGRKPDPGPLRAALDRLDASPTGGLMAGDGLQDLRAGRAVGLRTAAALYGFHDPAVLRAEGADQFWVAFGQPE